MRGKETLRVIHIWNDERDRKYQLNEGQKAAEGDAAHGVALLLV
jgi:hypothetical protein